MKQISAASSYSIPPPPPLIIIAMPYAYVWPVQTSSRVRWVSYPFGPNVLSAKFFSRAHFLLFR